MPSTYKVLGQASPSATTPTDLYAVPAATAAIVAQLVACNRAATQGTFRVSVRPAGAQQANQHYLYYDVAIEGNSSISLPGGLSLGAGDVVTVYASSASLSFTASGVEIA